MITFMFDIFCVTNRRICGEAFPSHIQKLAQAHPAGIILREKDLSELEYKSLAVEVIKLCDHYGVPCILHSFVKVAKELSCKNIHLPLSLLRTLSAEDKARFSMLGTSCHNVEEAKEAEWLGCSYIIAGHIFDTACKKNLPGRGIPFLKKMCDTVSLPVYAIGGITPENVKELKGTGAMGACLMSGAMKCENPQIYLKYFKM